MKSPGIIPLAVAIGVVFFGGPGFAEEPIPIERRDRTPPTGTITINAGAAYTRNVHVTLTLSATDDSGRVTHMRFSNDGSTYTAPEPYATSRSWDLLPGDGTKTVYVKYRDAAGNWSQAASDGIILDTTPPVVQITNPVDGQLFGAQ